MHDAWDDEAADDRLAPPLFVLVKGRTSPRNTTLDLATQVVALPADATRLDHEYQEIVTLCRTWISIAEIGAYRGMTLTVTKVIVDILLEQGLLAIGSPAQQRIADRVLLETVLDGLRRL